MKKLILVPITPSDISKEIVKAADRLANCTESKLIFIHSIKKGKLEEDQKELEKFIKNVNVTADFEAKSFKGVNYHIILDEEENCRPEFIMMPTHSHKLLERMLLGSTSDYILHHSTGSIFFYKAQAETLENIIIVPVDYSEVNTDVIVLADQFAQATQATLHFIHIYSPPPKAFYNLEYVWEIEKKSNNDRRESDRIRNITDEEQEKLEGYLGQADIKSDFASTVEYGKPYLHILALQQKLKAKLIMMPHHSYRIQKRYLPGSVTKYILHNSQCPVFVYKR